jgi:hypothetical protein
MTTTVLTWHFDTTFSEILALLVFVFSRFSFTHAPPIYPYIILLLFLSLA